MRDAYDEIAKTGVRLVVIGTGTAWQARAFREDERIPFELWVDPEMKAYGAVGMRRGIASTFSLRSPGHLFRALREGHRQGKVQGDPWQMGGVLLVRPDGVVVYEQISREAGDHAPLAEIMAALQRLG